MRLEVRHARAAIALAEEGSFSRAARRLAITQPTLSKLIQRLEDVAGQPLFHRRPSVHPTCAGELLLEHLAIVVEQTDRGFERIGRLAAGEVGALAIGLPTWVLATFVPDALQAHRSKRPNVELRLQDISSAAQLQGLRAGTLDLGFLRSAPDEPRISHELVWEEKFCLVVPKSHRLSQSPVIRVADLAKEPFIGFPRLIAPGLYGQIEELLASAHVVPKSVQEAHDWLTILVLVKAGVGVAVVPSSLARLWSDGVAFVPIENAKREVRTYVCWQADAPDTLVADFLDTLRHTRHTFMPKPTEDR
ncbi:MAG: LysR family transcriptional regulator [Sphingomicrobium sp.]